MYGWQQWGASYGGMQGGGPINSYGAGPMQDRMVANGGQVWQQNPLYPNAMVGQYQQDQTSYLNQPVWQQRYQPNYSGDGDGGGGIRGGQMPPVQAGMQQQQQQQQQQHQQRNADNTVAVIPVPDSPMPPLPQGSPPESGKKAAEPSVDPNELNPKDSKEQERLDQLKQQAQQWQAQQKQWQQFQEQQQQTYQQQMTYQHMSYHQPPQHPYMQQQGAMQAPVFNVPQQQHQQRLQQKPQQDAQMQAPAFNVPQQQHQQRLQQKPQKDAQMQPRVAAFVSRPTLPQPQAQAFGKPRAETTDVPSGAFKQQQQKPAAADVAVSAAKIKPSETASNVSITASKPPTEKDTQGQAVQQPQSGLEAQKPSGEGTGINPQVQAALDEFEHQLNSWNKQFEMWRSQNRDHPDRAAYDRYEKQWQAWRDQLVQRHTQMKMLADKQRGITPATTAVEPSKVGETKPTSSSVVTTAPLKPPSAPFGDRAPLLDLPVSMGSRRPQPDVRGVPRDVDFEDSNSSSMSRQANRYRGFDDEFVERGQPFDNFRREASMEGDAFVPRDRFYDEQGSRFDRPGSRNQFYVDDYGWSESRTGSRGGGFRSGGRNAGSNQGVNFDDNCEPFGFSKFEGGRGQFATGLSRNEGERGMMTRRGENSDDPMGQSMGRGSSTFDRPMMGQGLDFDGTMGMGGPMTDRGRGGLRDQPMDRCFEGMSDPPMSNYTSFNDDDSWDPSMVGGRNFDDDVSMSVPGGETWDPSPGRGRDFNQGRDQNVGRGRPIDTFEDQSGPPIAGGESTSASRPGKIPSLLPVEEIQSLRQASAEASSKTPPATSGSTNIPQGAKSGGPKQENKIANQACVQSGPTSKPVQKGPVRQPLLPTPGQPPQSVAKQSGGPKKGAVTPQAVTEKPKSGPAGQVQQPNSTPAKTPAVLAQPNKESSTKTADSSSTKEQKTLVSKESPAMAQKPATVGVSLYGDEDFTADVDISNIALDSWQQPQLDPVGGLQQVGTEPLSFSVNTLQSTNTTSQEESPKQPQDATPKHPQKPDVRNSTQKGSEAWQPQSKNSTMQTAPEDFGAKNVFQYDDCYVFMDNDEEERGSGDMDVDEDFSEENQYYGGYQQQGPWVYDQMERRFNQFARGRSQAEGMSRSQGRGRGQPEVMGHGQGRGRGQPEGRGRGQPEGRGRGQPEGRGRGQPEGRGRGQPEVMGHGQGRGRGQPEGRGRGQSEGRGRGQPEGRGRGQPAGRGRGQPEGMGRGQKQARGRGKPEGKGIGQPEGRGRGQPEGRGRGQAEREHDDFERRFEHDDRGHAQSERGRDLSEREDQGERRHDQFESGQSQLSRGRDQPERGSGTGRSVLPVSSTTEEFQSGDITFGGIERGATSQRGKGQGARVGNTYFEVLQSGFEDDFPNQYEDYMEPEHRHEAFGESKPRRNQISQGDPLQLDSQSLKPRPVSPAVNPAASMSDKGLLPPLAIAGTITRALTADEQNIILRAAEELKALQDMKEKVTTPTDDTYGGYGLTRPSAAQLPAPKRPRMRESRWGDFDETTPSEPQQQRGWKEDMFARDDDYGTVGESATQDVQQKSNASFAFQERKQSWDPYERQGWTKDAMSERRDSYGQNPNYVDQRFQSSDTRFYDERDKWVGESGVEIDHFAPQSRQPDGFSTDREPRTEYGLTESRISIDYGHKLSVAAVAQQIPSLEAVVPELYNILQPPPMPALSNLGLIETIDYAHGQKAVSKDEELGLGDRSRERLSPSIKDREFRDGRASGRYQDRDAESDKYGFDRGDRTSKNWDRDRDSDRQQQQRDRDWDSRDRSRERGDRDRQSGRSRDSDRDYPRRRDDSRERSSSYRDYRSSKDHHPTFPIDSSHRASGGGSAYSKPAEIKSESVLIEDLLSTEARRTRPPRIVIILRGPPGSGKTFVAKLIKDKEVENGGSAPRMLCLDDYFMLECEKVKKDPETGKKVKIKALEYEYEPEMEESYRGSLFKTFKKTLEDGFFPFTIVDAINEKIKYCEEMWSFAKQKGFQVYIAEMDMDGSACHKRNIHGRSLDEINKMIAKWEATPRHYLKVDVRSLLQDAAITEVHMEDTVEEKEASAEEPDIEIVTVHPVAVLLPKDEVAAVALSKWEKMEATEERLDKLDGLRSVKRKRDVPQSLEDYLQLPDDYEQRESQPGKKRVRWADIEEGKDMERRRAVGFVVGQTDWKKLTDPTHAQRALTRTKYI